MKTLAYLVCFAGAAALAFAQENRKATASTPATAEQAARAAIDRGHEAFMAAMRANDADALAKLQAPDVVFYPPNSSPLVGPEAVRRSFQSVFEKMKTTSASVTNRKVTLVGDQAIEEGHFTWSMAPVGGGAAVEDRGQFMAIWQRQSDGSWKATRDIWNSSLPAAGAAASSAADPWLGTWVLNLEKTRINPGPAAKGETRTYASTANGERATYDEIQADGKRVSSTSTYRFDGQDAKVVGDPDSHTQAITRTSPRSIASVIKKDGKVVRTATREVSADGKSLVVEFKGTNARGQPIIEEKWVFDRATTGGEWLSLRFTTVKPEKVAEFERLQKEELIPALKKGGVTSRGASSYATFGDGYVFAFGQPLKNFAELDDEDPLVNALGAAGASALLTKLRACHVTTRVLGIRNVTDLSWEHDQPLPMFVVERHELAPGRKAEWLAFMREHFAPTIRKAGVKQYVVQETVFGGNSNEVYTLRFLERYGELDTGGLRRQLGNEAYTQLVAKLPTGVVTQSERFVVRTRPDLSILPAAKPKPTE